MNLRVRRALRSVMVAVSAGYLFSLYYILWTDLPGEWFSRSGLWGASWRIASLGALGMFFMVGWLFLPLTPLLIVAIRRARMLHSSIYQWILVSVAAVGFTMVLAYLGTFQLVWLEDGLPFALGLEAQRLAVRSMWDSLAYWLPPCGLFAVVLAARARPVA